MRRAFLSLAVAALVAGCTTTTGVVEVGDGSYMLGSQTSGSWSGSSVKADQFKQAAAYCTRNGEKLKLLGEKTQDASFYSYASSEIRFTCE